jgi:hypothetical protein
MRMVVEELGAVKKRTALIYTEKSASIPRSRVHRGTNAAELIPPSIVQGPSVFALPSTHTELDSPKVLTAVRRVVGLARGKATVGSIPVHPEDPLSHAGFCQLPAS